jgi:dipeptidyl-peptidase-3
MGIPLTPDTTGFQWRTEMFADVQINRYIIPGWEKLTPQQRMLTYYLVQAGLEGRDIMYDMNYRHNLEIRKALEDIYRKYDGDRAAQEWSSLETYLKRIWFSSGIHHHYSMNKFAPDFSQEYLEQVMEETGTSLSQEALQAIFDPEKDPKKVNLDPESDLVLTSAVNFYEPDITQTEVEAYFESIIDKEDETPVSYGLNSKIVRLEDGSLGEQVYKVGGLYGPAIEKMVEWLQKAVTVAENQAQADALKLLIEYYQTGDLEKWDEYNIAWSQATAGDIDYITGFVEVYQDPMGYHGSFETIVQVNDFEATQRMKVLMENAQWFEDNSPLMDEHKKDNVVGVSYKVVNVAGESGDASPSTPIGVNLPNANWIRSNYGSKSVSLGNILDGYKKASAGGFEDEFLLEEESDRVKIHGSLSSNMHTALHEVLGHASGKIEPGVGTPKETLKNYRSAMEEGRADLFALYYILDPKMVELGLVPSDEVGKSEYDTYITNGIMYQLRRLQLGEEIEESHMRNRAMVARWAYEHGKGENVIERVKKDGKTFFKINDYQRLRELFGELLREVQRIKSQGDFEAAQALIEDYAVQVDPELHKEVLDRVSTFKGAPYGGFINPRLLPVIENEKIVDVRVEYPEDFTEQMLEYSEWYGNL